MGIYISLFIEVDYNERSPPFSEPRDIFSLTEGSFNLGKDYEVFDALADGRNDALNPEDRDPSRGPLFPPRGMPERCSLDAGWDYYRLIVDPPELPDHLFWPESRCVSSEVAEDWVRSKGCHEARFLQWFNCGCPEGIWWRAVSQPELYNATWLRLDEFDASLKHRDLDLAKIAVEYRVIRASLSLLVEEFGLERVRLVFWFC